MKKKQTTGCCDDNACHGTKPNHTKELHRINRISGQLEGVKRMIIHHEYCPKIIIQIQAIRAALKSLESVLLGEHLDICVKSALSCNNPTEAEEKLAELLELFRRN